MDLGAIWHTLIVEPLTWALLSLAGFTGQAGLAIILLTLIIRLLMLPLSIFQMKSQKAMMALQPELAELRKKYAKDPQRMTQEQMRLYRERGVNPATGCLPLLLQMPIFIGLYSVLFTESQHFEQQFIWIPSLAHPDPIYILPLLTMATQFVLQKMMAMPTSDPQQEMMNRTMLFMPLVFGFITFSLPAGVVLYWVASNIFSMVQQYFTTGWGSLFPRAAASGAHGAPPKAGVTEQPKDGAFKSLGAQAKAGGKSKGRKSGGKR